MATSITRQVSKLTSHFRLLLRHTIPFAIDKKLVTQQRVEIRSVYSSTDSEQSRPT